MLPLDLKYNYALARHNTLAIESNADIFVTIKSTVELKAAMQQYGDEAFLVLGGGSNTLFDQTGAERWRPGHLRLAHPTVCKTP